MNVGYTVGGSGGSRWPRFLAYCIVLLLVVVIGKIMIAPLLSDEGGDDATQSDDSGSDGSAETTAERWHDLHDKVFQKMLDADPEDDPHKLFTAGELEAYMQAVSDKILRDLGYDPETLTRDALTDEEAAAIEDQMAERLNTFPDEFLREVETLANAIDQTTSQMARENWEVGRANMETRWAELTGVPYMVNR